MSDLGFKHASELLESVVSELTNPPMGNPLPWWTAFTDETGGLRGGELSVLSAPTGAGKTQLLANIACQLWEGNIPCFVAPVETGDRDFLIRMISVLERTDWNTGKAYPADRVNKLLDKYLKAIETRPLYISTYENRVAVEDMEALLRLMATKGVRVALLDNLNFFLKVTRSSDQLLEIDEAVRVIGNVAKQTKMHIILICHPKKPETKDTRITSENELKGSSTIVQEAANVFLWNRPEENSNCHSTDRFLTIRKMRKRGILYNKSYRFSYSGGRFEEFKGRV